MLRGAEAAVLAFEFEEVSAAIGDDQQIGGTRANSETLENCALDRRARATVRNVTPPCSRPRAPLQLRVHASLQLRFGLLAAGHRVPSILVGNRDAMLGEHGLNKTRRELCLRVPNYTP